MQQTFAATPRTDEFTASDMTRKIPGVAFTAMCNRLKRLFTLGLLDRRRVGREQFYSRKTPTKSKRP